MKKIINWKDKVIYQIFPRSYYDSNNDGDGDLKGIIEKLDYISDLGVDAIWLCPTYDTDFADAGYDVKDYMSVWKPFGTIDDFKKLSSEASKRGIDIIMDIVLNHVSSDHNWFKKALESEDNIEHDYFIWRKTLNKAEKEAKSIFGGSAWEYVTHLKKYYFHLFAKEQIDLNWDHPNTIQAMAGVIDFWYELGVKGFRLDAIKHISKEFPKGNKSSYSWGSTAVKNLKKFNEIAFNNKPDAFTFGESSGITKSEAIKYGTGNDKVASNFYDFSWWWIGWGKDTGRNGYDPSWDYRDFVKSMKTFQESDDILPGLMTNFLSNHDTSRAISRWGNEGLFWKESAKSLAMMLFVMKGIPCIYYGEEIGMLNPGFDSRDEFRDVDAKNAYDIFVDKEGYYSELEMTKYHAINSRDNCRTPMAWNGNNNAGFNGGSTPWIKIGKGFDRINVESQIKDKTSILSFYKEIIKLRKSKQYKDILIDGSSKFELLKSGAFQVTRTSANGKKIISLINIRDTKVMVKIPTNAKIILTTWDDNKYPSKLLRSYESIIYELV